MQNGVIACVQPRMTVLANQEESEAALRRYLRQPQARAAQLVVFPELLGIMFAPALISRLKLGFIRRADRGRRPTAGFMARRMGRVAHATAEAMGGGLRGSLSRLLEKDSAALQDAYEQVFAKLAREFAVHIIAGSTYIRDGETNTIRNRACLFSSDGELLGYQDKLHLGRAEEALVTPGTALPVFETSAGRVGILVGRDAMVPELARLLAVRGADLLVGCAAVPGEAQARMLRRAMSLRAEENQVFAAASFLIGPNYLDRDNPIDYRGRSVVLSPISLTDAGDGILIQAGSDRTEAVIGAALDAEGLRMLRETGRFRPRSEMNLAGLGPALAEFYGTGRSIEQAAQEHYAAPAVQIPEPPAFAQVFPSAEEPQPETAEPEPDTAGDSEEAADEPQQEQADMPEASIPEALSLTSRRTDD